MQDAAVSYFKGARMRASWNLILTFTGFSKILMQKHDHFSVGGGMGMQSGVTQLKLEMHEYKEMGLSVGDKVFLELSKAETLGV